jgi:formate--tetrahydrofolate ligase
VAFVSRRGVRIRGPRRDLGRMRPVLRPIQDVAQDLGFGSGDIEPWGPGVAKIRQEAAFRVEPQRARLVLVSALTPTPAGEGKTTCTIGLTQAARRLGVRAACALREPSLGPVFGKKGGGTGGGKSTIEPSTRINLHFTGDLHAITAAHNLLAALIDNGVFFRTLAGGKELDRRQITLKRSLDLNDRALRRTVIGLGGKGMGEPREDGFDITAASEVMAILCLAKDHADLKRRLGDMLVGWTRDGEPVFARDIGAEGAMAALLSDALLPNLVQTAEGVPALVHGGPFANIAHGCNSLVATRLGLGRADVLFTEAGFGFDLGGEKFLDIKCRIGGFFPASVVLVGTLRALKCHGGVRVQDADKEDSGALVRGLENLRKHVESARLFGIEPIVALNVRAGDSKEELRLVLDRLKDEGVDGGEVDVFAHGGEGALALAEKVLGRLPSGPQPPRFAYALEDPPDQKIRTIARGIYGARDVEFTPLAKSQLERAARLGLDHAPVCMAKTHLSLSDDEKKIGRPRDFVVTVREVRVSAGAGFLVALTGEILTMPGLPKRPQALDIDIGPGGAITGVR